MQCKANIQMRVTWWHTLKIVQSKANAQMIHFGVLEAGLFTVPSHFELMAAH